MTLNREQVRVLRARGLRDRAIALAKLRQAEREVEACLARLSDTEVRIGEQRARLEKQRLTRGEILSAQSLAMDALAERRCRADLEELETRREQLKRELGDAQTALDRVKKTLVDIQKALDILEARANSSGST